jgi:hypothetical protein
MVICQLAELILGRTHYRKNRESIFDDNDLFSAVFGCRNYSIENKTYFRRLLPNIAVLSTVSHGRRK